MLNKEIWESLANFTGIPASDLEAKIKSEGEEDITLPTRHIFTDDELQTRDNNTKTHSYNEGKDAGVEMSVKAAKKELGYDFPGKDMDSLLEFHATKIKSSFGKPNEKITELESDIANLNATNASALEEKDNIINGLKSDFNRTVVNNQLLSIIPKEISIPKDDMMVLFNNTYQVEIEDGKTIVKQNGETLKDTKTASPLGLEDVFMNYAIEKNYLKKTSGRGDGNDFGGSSSPKSVSEFHARLDKEGIPSNSPERDTRYQEWREKNPDVTA